MLLLKPSPIPGTPQKKSRTKRRTKRRIKVRSRFDRAGGAVAGEFIYDEETDVVTVREKGAKRSYSMRMSELCELIARRGLGVGG